MTDPQKTIISDLQDDGAEVMIVGRVGDNLDVVAQLIADDFGGIFNEYLTITAEGQTLYQS